MAKLAMTDVRVGQFDGAAMPPSNAMNNRILRSYRLYLREVEGQADKSIDQADLAIAKYRAFTGDRDFSTFRLTDAIEFKQHLRVAVSAKTGDQLSPSMLVKTLGQLSDFFVWLSLQSAYRSKIAASDALYFSPTRRERTKSNRRVRREAPELGDVCSLIRGMPTDSLVAKRNQAIISALLVTGARSGAMASFRTKHLDINERLLSQIGTDARTKHSKTIMTWFFPVPEDIQLILLNWKRLLLEELRFSDDDALFPSDFRVPGPDGLLVTLGLSRSMWETESPVRRIVANACASAGIPPWHPHDIRRTLVKLGLQICRNLKELKAWSQNLGHEDIIVTLRDYGMLSSDEQRTLIRQLEEKRPLINGDTKIADLLRIIGRG